MIYSKLQKFLSGLIIFALLGATTFRVPFLNYSIEASSLDYFDLVAIVVEEDIYPSISSKVNTYAKNIQGVLENTKAVILPIPKDISSFNIASMLESLYFDGYKGLDSSANFESALVGTVLVGDIALPQVFIEDSYVNTIVPYTDFIDKRFIYNNQTKRYEKNNNNIDGIKSEIWHGVISPNTGSESGNIQAIKDYFDKNNNFYHGTGNFKFSDGMINGNSITGVKSDYEPYVFYFDNFRENKAFNYNLYESYLGYLENKEDIVYDRFTKELAAKVADKLLNSQEDTISELIAKVDPTFDISGFTNSPVSSEIPDIQTRSIIEQATKTFIETFSNGTIGDFRKNVHNAGRYNKEANSVNVDFVPYLITVLDLVNDELIKRANTLLEDKIDEIVINDLQKNIIIPYKIDRIDTYTDVLIESEEVTKTDIYGNSYTETINVDNSIDSNFLGAEYENFLYGKRVKEITKADECSIFIGSKDNEGKVVEANRINDISVIESDIDKLKSESTSCLNKITSGTSLSGYWGGNTPLNIDYTTGVTKIPDNKIDSINPLFSINGSKEVISGNYSDFPKNNEGKSYLDCLEDNFLKVSEYSYDDRGGDNTGFENIKIYQLPIDTSERIDNLSGRDRTRTCSSQVEHLGLNIKDYNILKNETYQKLILNSEPQRYETTPKCSGFVCIEIQGDKEYKIFFKTIPSYLIHKSPTYEEIDSQIKYMISPDLPVDRDRYIDFKNQGEAYQKINYPYLFRLGTGTGQDLDIPTIKSNLQTYLGNYNSTINFNLYNYLGTQANSFGDKGTYLDTLVFSMYWNNLSIAGKYKFVFENYLSDQDGGNSYNFSLAKNKSQYEIAYLGANGDAQNMYVLLDPESKSQNPYAKEISDKQALQNSLIFSNNDESDNSGDGVFKCAPPEGVPLWQWFPAITCWLGNMMPPTISISTSSCSTNNLLTQDDKDQILNNGGDTNKNGIIDCIEDKLTSGSLDLTSDSSKYYYGNVGELKAQIKDSSGKLVTLDSQTNIKFELIEVKVQDNKNEELTENNSKIIYSKNVESSTLNDQDALNKIKEYIDFVDGDVRAQFGEAKKSFYIKDKDADFVFKVSYSLKSFDGSEVTFVESDELKVRVRGEKLFVNNYKISKDTSENRTIDPGLNNVLVSDKNNIFISQINNFDTSTLSSSDLSSQAEEKIILNLINYNSTGNKKELNYPISIDIYKDGEKLNEITTELDSINGFESLGSFEKSGSYEFLISDNTGYTIRKQIEILPEVASRIEISEGANIIETGGSVVTNVVTLYDEYDNIAKGTFYDLEIEINGDGLVFESNNEAEENKKTFSIFEGFKVFQYKSTTSQDDNEIVYKIKGSENNEFSSLDLETKNVRTVDDIVIGEINPIGSSLDEIKVGGGEYSYELVFHDSIGNTLSDFNSRAYLNIPKIYGETTKDYFDIENGKTIVSFKTKNVASKKVPIELQVEGLSQIISADININPEIPMYIDLYLSSENIEAADGEDVNVRAELKDRYGNLVFNDSSTTASIEILDKYNSIINSSASNISFDEGKATFDINATPIPGIGYFKVFASSLESNIFTIESVDSDGNDNSLTVNGVGSAIGQVKTSYFWNKDKIDGKKYNSIYTTLLGSNYGDITKKDYLAGALLFDRDNRALGVTSLLNIPYQTSNVLNIKSNGKINPINTSDLSQDINLYTSFSNDKLYLDIYNDSLDTYIGKVYYNFDEDKTSLLECNNISNCSFDDNDTSIFIKTNLDYSSDIKDDRIEVFNSFNNKVLEISKDGTIKKYANINFNLNNDYSNNSVFDIELNGENIAELGFNFKGTNNTNISRDESLFEQKINTLKNYILVLLESNLYLSKDSIDSKVIYYNDPFRTPNKINNYSSDNTYGYENFINEEGLGWKEGNKVLLEFASGKSMGEAVKDYMSFGVINLGDPVMSLKKIKEKLPGTNDDRKFDSTIGKLISNEDNLLSFQVFDYNNDNKDDILLIKRNGFLQLLENKDISSNFLNKGDLANIIDLGDNELLKTGDFSGDGFDDIFFVNNKGKVFLLNNDGKDFLRYDLNDQFELEGKVIRVEVFDMDNDGKDDIVTLDDNGEINIFYGGGTILQIPFFQKKLIDDSYGLKLSSQARNDNGLLYFDGLYQLPAEGDNSELIQSSQDYLNAGANGTNFNYDLIDNSIFEKLTYDPNNMDNPNNQIQNTQDNKSKANSYQINNFSLEDFQDLQTIQEDDLTRDFGEEINFLPGATSSGALDFQFSENYTTFIKSEYSDVAGVKIEKTFSDINGSNLKSGDIIQVQIKLKNNSGGNLEKIAYGEKIDYLFDLDKESIETSSSGSINFNTANTDFLIDNFELSSGGEFIINYKTTLRDIEYGYIKAGLFENGEVGDDDYGDIIFSTIKESCSQDVDIFRSIASKEYQKGIKTPECDASKVALPSSISQNTLDANGNGIPDYIDELSNTSDTTALEQFSQDNLSNFNDSSSYDDDSRSIDEQIEQAMDTADNVINSISCGFGAAGCIATPLNWAPLAPGGDPTMFGQPIGDGLKVDEGMPIFSALTGLPTPVGCLPAVWPLSPIKFEPPLCGGALTPSPPPGPPFSITGQTPLGAGGLLGVDSITNFFRLFITPTLTGSVGTAICFGGPASVVGISIPKGISPIVPGGNCIVLAAPLSQCSDDGSDGDVASTGFSMTNTSEYGIINGSCSMNSNQNNTNSFEQSLVNDYYDFRKTGSKSSTLDSRLNSTYNDISNGTTNISIDPLLKIGNNGNSDLQVSLNFNSLTSGNFSDVIEIQKSRNSDFPQFLMNWVTRQIEEIANKLTDFPTVFIIFPDFTGLFDGDWAEKSGNNDLDYENFVDIDNQKVQTAESGIKEAYHFLSQIPLVKFDKQSVDLDIPWIDRVTIDKYIESWGSTLTQRQEEFEDFSASVTFGITCDSGDTKCEEQNALNEKIKLDSQALISSLEANIGVLEDYKAFPEKIYNWLNVKEKYLEQILCNVESISELIGGRIGKNGERFKAWVNLYILIKAILKSWQAIIDLFTDYEAECHDCKNERMDLMTYIWGLIDMIIPKIPVIQFPKWPDIILDLHNIRAGLTISLPEFNINKRPILLPYLPDLKLPRVPDVNFILPELPILPTIELPELPDIPSLPSIKLPDLPPPPTLPKLISQISGVVDILKLITKLMCILKRSPFVPEWRAGDQIAFLTERQGYLDLDFSFGISTPQFSFPFVDAIKVTTYVNLEFETDFIVELARQAAIPVNNFTNNIVNLLNYNVVDIDLNQYSPNEINVELGEIGLNKDISKAEVLSIVLVKNIKKLYSYISENKDETLSIQEFQQIVSKQLASKDFISDPKNNNLRKIWQEVNDYSYSKEDKYISDLQDNHNKKFDLVKDIINTQIVNNKKEIEEFNKKLNNDYINKVSFTQETNIDFYNKQLEVYNNEFKDSVNDLFNKNQHLEIREELKGMSNDILDTINTKVNNFANETNTKLLAATGPTGTTGPSQTTCQAQAESDYKYTYEGLYVVEDDISYRLIDFLDELKKDEEVVEIDYDNDGDTDLLYILNSELYLKENLADKKTKTYVSENPIVLTKNNNKFLNGDIFYEAINNFESSISENDFINLSFVNSTRDNINSYRIELFSIVDKFLNDYNFDNSGYNPQDIKKSIIDAFSSIDETTISMENTPLYQLRKNLGYIKNTGGNLSNIRLRTYDFENIKDNISENNFVNLTTNSVLYSASSDVKITYTEEDDDQNETNLKTLIIPEYSNITLNRGITVAGVNADAYIKTNNIINIDENNINSYKGLPLLAGTKIYITRNEFSQSNTMVSSYIEIKYFDGTQADLDFDKIESYYLYDLGSKSEDSYIRISKDSDYLYGKIRSFKNNIFSTFSNQILLYPQLEADSQAPEINLAGDIRIPVYQKQIIDITDYIYESSGIDNIDDIFIDFDLELDGTGSLDGNLINDRDSDIDDRINITKTSRKIEIEFGEFEEIFIKDIGINIIDKNGNIGYSKLKLEVYSPIPNIESFSSGTIYGRLDEKLSDEPIDFYRYRSGLLKKLTNKSGTGTSYTNEVGGFVFEVGGTNEFGTTKSDLVLTNSGQTIAKIDENTGVITNLGANSQIKVISSNDSGNDGVFPKIIISNSGNDIYSQSIFYKGENNLTILDSLDQINENSQQGVYIDFINEVDYGYFQNPEGINYNAGALFIYRNSDIQKKPLFTIFKDGRIDINNEFYSLKYFTYNNKLGFDLIYNNSTIAKVLFNINGEFAKK